MGDENLYWSDLKSPENAYDAWYWTEKEMYDKGETDPSKVGHYTNLRDSANNYSVIGIAVHDRVMNEDGTFKHYSTVSQTFNTTEVIGDGEENFVFTVERYEELFMKYYNDLHAQLNGEEAAQKALDDAKIALTQAITGVNIATEKSDEAKKILDAATSKTEAQQGTVNTIEGELNTLTKELEEKNQTLTDAQKNLDKVTQDVVNAQKESDALKESIQAQNEKLQQAKEKADAADAVLKEKEQIRNEAKDAYDTLAGQTDGKIPSVEEADQMLKEAQDVKNQAIQTLENAKANEAEKRDALAKANEAATKAIEEVAKKEQLVKDTEANHAQILAGIYEKLQNEKNAMDTAKTTLDDAKAVLEAAKQAVEEAEKNFQKGDAKVKELYKELEAAQKDYEAKAAEHSESKAAYENAQKDYDTVVEAITPLREAKAEYDKAVADRKAQEMNVEKADQDVLVKEALSATAKDAADGAKKDYDIVSGVTVDSLLETPMTDEEYLYLNAYVDEYKKSLAEKEQAAKNEQANIDKVSALEIKYEDAKKYAVQTNADLLIAQDNYDKAVENSKPEQTESIVKVQFVDENGNVIAGGDYFVDADGDGIFHHSELLGWVPEGYEMKKTSGDFQVEVYKENPLQILVTKKEVPDDKPEQTESIVKVQFVDENGNVIAGGDYFVDADGDGIFHHSELLEWVPEGYELKTVGDFQVEAYKETPLQLTVVKNVVPEEKPEEPEQKPEENPEQNPEEQPEEKPEQKPNGSENNNQNHVGKDENNSESKDENKNQKAPKTADYSPVGTLSLTLLGSATIAAMAAVFKRKRRTDKK